MMNERKLRYIIEIAKEGNITTAAQNLFITQPSLSSLLMGVEKELGAKLFDRSVSPMTLTYAGEQYITAAEKILGTLHELQHQIDDMNESLTGRLHIGCGPQQSPFLIPAILPPLINQYPGIQFKLLEDNRAALEEQLLSGTLDVILCGGKVNHQNVECLSLSREEIMLLTPVSFQPPYTTTRSGKPYPCLNFSDLGPVPLVLMKKRHRLRVMLDHIFLENQYMPNIILETDNWQTCLRMVQSGIAFSILPNAKTEQNTEHVRKYSFEKDYFRQTFLCYRKNAYLPKIMQEFIKVAHAAFL